MGRTAAEHKRVATERTGTKTMKFGWRAHRTRRNGRHSNVHISIGLFSYSIIFSLISGNHVEDPGTSVEVSRHRYDALAWSNDLSIARRPAAVAHDMQKFGFLCDHSSLQTDKETCQRNDPCNSADTCMFREARPKAASGMRKPPKRNKPLCVWRGWR